MTEKLERDHRVNMRLSGKMYDRLKAVAEEMGMPASTVAAFAVGEFVSAKERQLRNDRQMMALASRQVGKATSEHLSELDVQSAAGDVVQQLLQDPEQLAALIAQVQESEEQK